MRTVLGILLLATVATAAPILVTPNVSLDTLRAERIDVGERFELVSIAFALTPAGLSASGPTEITEALTPAGTDVAAGHWTYTATLRETSAGSIASGRFLVELARDDEPQGIVTLAQDIANPAASEGARVTFDVGTTRPSAALFALVVREDAAGAPEIDLTSAIDASFNYVWTGAGGTTNPDVAGVSGAPMRFHIIDGEGTSPHNLRIKDASGNVVAGPTPDIVDPGDEETLDWTPSEAGAYRYDCRYHPTMTGDVTIS